MSNSMKWLIRCGLCVLVVAAAYPARAAEPAAIGRVNLTLAQYKAAKKEMEDRDYRPASLSVYRFKGENHYAAMFHRTGQLKWKEELGSTFKAFEEGSKTKQDEEFRPISLHVLIEGGQPRYNVIWKQLDGEFYYFRDKLTAETFKKFSDDYSQKDIFPASICAYELRGQIMFAAIWEKSRPNGTKYELGLTEAALAQKTKDLKGANFTPQFLAGYMSRGKPLWAAIWVQQEGVEVEALPSMSEPDWQKRSAELEKAGYDLMSLQGAILSGKPRFSAVWRKVKDLPEESTETK